ncbi:hypothetical protein ACWGSE_28245 [Streptomyces diastaticus]|uniref:hypothetical protein n=1 Tax=Streptomyces diastaticus TaxID=1956 RepID=UPI0035E11598
MTTTRPGTGPDEADEPYEPVFKPALGGARYVYNHRNPVGLALMALAPLVALGVILHLHDSGSWSREELRSAVYGAAEEMNRAPHVHNSDLGYAWSLEDAVDRQPGTPFIGASVHRGTGPDRTAYTVTGSGTSAVYCLHVYEGHDTAADRSILHVSAEDGPC